MKRNYFFLLSLGLILFAGFGSGGCTDTLLPPSDNSGTPHNNSGSSDKITLKGDLILETPLPADARVVLIWGVSTGSDYSYVDGEGTIDRTNNTFQITMDREPATSAINWISRSSYDTGFGAAIIALVPSSVPNGFIDNLNTSSLYGVVNYTNLIYFKSDPLWWRTLDPGPNHCHDWTKEFGAGYQLGKGQEAADGCTFDGFTPGSPTGLQILVNADHHQFSFVNWT